MTDQEILTRLQDDPERGMEQIVEQYTGLLWSVAGQLLQEPEDIKDCVNEAFAQFYSQREEFDPDKGSLKGYLVVIAHRLAIKKYQDNQRRAGGEFVDAEDTDRFRLLEQKDELDAYLHTLDAVDEQIIRMKYYDGMTAKEIAASLGLPYETVKKRHQRSLKKLRKAMLIGLVVVIAAVLAACAYTVLRYFGVVPGYGVSTDPGAGVYVLEEAVAVTGGEFDLTITDAWWMNGVLTVDAAVTIHDTSLMPAPNNAYTAGEWAFKQMTVEGVEQPEYLVGITDDSAESRCRQLYQCSLPKETKDTLILTFRWENGAVCTLTLKRAESEVSYEQAGYYDMTEHDGGLLAVPRLENGELIVAVYTLSEGDYVIEPMLTSGIWSSAEENYQDITVTAADGRVLVGQRISTGPFDSKGCHEWNFGPAEPGEYTLNVPYVYETLSGAVTGEAVAQTIELTGEAADLDVVFAFHGGEARMTHMEPSDYVYAMADIEELRALNEVYAQFQWWDIDTEYVSLDPERTVLGMGFSAVKTEEDVVVESGGITLSAARSMTELRTEDVGDGIHQRVIGLRVGTFELDEVVLEMKPEGIGYRWNREFNIEFEVDETE